MKKRIFYDIIVKIVVEKLKKINILWRNVLMIERDLTSREIWIMKCIWANPGGMTLQDLQKELKEIFDWEIKRFTIHTYLTTIEGKGYIEVEKKGRNLIMKPSISEEEHKKEQAERMISFWYDGSRQGLIKTLVGDNISQESGRHLMDVLDELEEI